VRAASACIVVFGDVAGEMSLTSVLAGWRLGAHEGLGW
jgi:hypothetical protein